MTYCAAIGGAPFRLEDSMYGDVFNWLIHHDSYFSYMDGLLASGLYGECQMHFFLSRTRYALCYILTTHRSHIRSVFGRVLDNDWSCQRVEHGRTS
jgi:hypothetical protein